jgi:phage gpG-like protein
MQIKIALVGDRELVAQIDSLPQQVHDQVKQAITALSINLRTKVMTEQLSGPTGAHTLSVVTGRLRRSIAWHVDEEGDSRIVGTVTYSPDVPYARIHELGGTIHIPEITAKNAKALHFMWQGREVFFKKVSAHDVHMPARAPLKTAFQNYIPTIKSELQEAVNRAFRVHS